MTSKPNPTDERWAAWLGDVPGSVPTPPDSVTEALDALYAQGPGAAATRQAQARLQGALRGAAQPGGVYYDVIPRSPIGPVFVAVGEQGLLAVRFGMSERAFTQAVRQRTGLAPQRSPDRASAAVRQVRDYLAGQRRAFDLPVDLSTATDFQRRVLLAACQIPRGQVATYAEVARRIGQPRAARAVGQALRHNPVPIVVPCHRVLAADGSLGGYLGRGGTATKRQLLQLEGALPA